MEPQYALSIQFHEQNPGLVLNLVRRFRIFHRGIENPEQSIQNEFADLLFHQDMPDDLLNENISVEEFWFGIYDLPNNQGEYPFRNLAKFCLRLLTLSHSNAEVERWFSAQNNTHTHLRNKLYVETVDGILLLKQRIKITGDCTNYQPDQNAITKYLQMFNNYDYYDEN